MSPNSPPPIEATEPPRRFPSGYVDDAHLGHHMNDSKTRFTNPLPSFRLQTYSDWIHACYLVELSTPPGVARGVHVIFDFVFSNLYSPFQWLGVARYTVEEISAIDAIVLSYSHYDHTDISTLCALPTNPSSSAHIFVALNNANYLSKALRTAHSHFHELDYWDGLQQSCTSSRHVSGRTAFGQWQALWAAWVVDNLHSHQNVYFAGDTGYHKVPVCPAFAQVRERFGGVDVALSPISSRRRAYSPRAMWSKLHGSLLTLWECSRTLKLRKPSQRIGGNYPLLLFMIQLGVPSRTWVLTLELVLDPPELLKK
ncbi:N-acyl-phosphatidylethanolamine-hydrolyzing phospholipase D [Lactarius psammicola]|nr:N-acyl-phosphatidylethanolamine-hydrolyzing phospholipase D [Lactarius psammicola]